MSFFRKITALLLLLSSPVLASETDVQLKNAGFEDTAEPATPAYISGREGWQCSPVKDACTRIKDSQAGQQAVHLRRGSLHQKIEIGDLRGKQLTLSFQAKGTGMLKCSLSYFYKDESGKWKRAALASNMGAGCPLTDQYLQYELNFSQVPEKALYLMLSFNDSAPTDWYIDEVKLRVSDKNFDTVKKAQKAISEDAPLPEGYFNGNGKIPEGLVNISPLAKIKTEPFSSMTYRVCDGIMGTGLSFENFPVEGAKVIDFIYDTPVTADKIRISVPSTSFAVYADVDGDGKFTKELKSVRNGPVFSIWNRKNWPWVEINTEPGLKVRGIRYIDFAPKASPVMEFQILSAGEKPIPSPELPELPGIEEGKALTLPVPKENQKYLQGFTIEPWMFNCPGIVKEMRKGNKVNFKDWPAYKKMIEDYDFFSANFMLLFPPKTCERVKGRKGTFAWDVMWPSKVWRWYTEENLLKEFCEAVNEKGISVFTVIRYRYFKLDLPYPDKDKLETFGLYGENVAQSVAEMAEGKANGVSLCLDEEYFNAGYPVFYFQKFTVPENADKAEKKKIEYKNELADKRREAFEKRWNLKLEKFPHRPEDNDLYRKYVIFYYEEIARMMKHSSEKAKKANPSVKTLAAFATTDQFNNRLEQASDHDTFGFGADIDYMFADPYFTREDPLGWYKISYMTQVLRASSPKRQAGLTLNYNWGGMKPERNPLTFETYPGFCYIGAVLAGAFNKAGAFDFWRYNHACSLDPIKGGRENIKKAFSMLDTLAAWGGKNAEIPKATAILRSRASEDWWQLKTQFGDWKGKRTECSRGYSYFKWVCMQLLRNGYPFETYFSEHPEAYEDLSEYKTVIVPFPYSMSRKTFEKIMEAVSKGTEVIVLGAKGEVDELGKPYETPLLEEMISNGKITYFDRDILKEAHFPETGKAFRKLLNEKLGDKRSLKLERYGNDVQATCLELNPHEQLVLLMNWNDSDSTVDLGVSMPEDKTYRIICRTPEKLNEMTLKGKNIFSASDLQNFRVNLKGGEALILKISPAEGSGNE